MAGYSIERVKERLRKRDTAAAKHRKSRDRRGRTSEATPWRERADEDGNALQRQEVQGRVRQWIALPMGAVQASPPH